MKLKHWQGYGTVVAKKISYQKSNDIITLKIRVTGNHEYGIECRDDYTVTNWLLKRFDKNFNGNYRNIISIETLADDINQTCDYVITYHY